MVVVSLAALVIGFLLPPAAAADSVSCQNVTIPVSLGGQQESMYGRLCQPSQPTSTVIVLVPGGTYANTYWDLPASLGLYSFRAAMNEPGYATLTVDRLGSGLSSRPVGASLTALTQAGVLHQVVGRMRSGGTGPGYRKVIVGGHSLGATIVLIEAATYHDVDGVLAAGFAHNLDPVDLAAFFATLYPAALDPALVNRNYDVGYLTTRPGTRQQSFHRPAQPSAAVMAYEESTKDAFAVTEAPDGIGLAALTPSTILIDVPVLVAISGHDELLCSPIPLVGTGCSSSAALYQKEAPYYSQAARLRTYVLPGNYGHSFNFAPNADRFAATVVAWANEMVGH